MLVLDPAGETIGDILKEPLAESDAGWILVLDPIGDTPGDIVKEPLADTDGGIGEEALDVGKEADGVTVVVVAVRSGWETELTQQRLESLDNLRRGKLPWKEFDITGWPSWAMSGFRLGKDKDVFVGVEVL